MLTTLLLSALVLASAQTFPRPLSSKANQVYSAAVQISQASPDQSGVPASQLGGSGTFLTEELGYGDVPSHCEKVFYPAVLSAQKEVLVATFLFDRTSPCGKFAAKALVELNAKNRGKEKIRVYLILSTMSELAYLKKGDFNLPNIKQLFKSLTEVSPEDFNLPSKATVPNLDLRVKTLHSWILGTIHNKLLIVDGSELVAGSKNWDALPGFEYTSRMRGSIAGVARVDFERMWKEPLPQMKPANLEGGVPMVYLSRVSNSWPTHPTDNAQNVAWLAAIQAAQKSVLIMSPNFTTREIAESVLEAVRRGVKVTVITGFKFHNLISRFNTHAIGNNGQTIQYMYTQLKGEAAVNNLTMCYFIGKRVQPPKPDPKEFAHVKFMAVDDEFFIYGSGNQDTQSWFNSSEGNFLVDDAKETKRLSKLLLGAQQSLEFCYRDLEGEKMNQIDPVEPAEPEIPDWPTSNEKTI